MADRGEVKAARRGRRPGPTVGREQILEAARGQFAAHGYPDATIRRIAEAAGVDSKLVHYYFGTKEELFTAVISDAFRARGFPALLTSNVMTPDTSPGTLYLRAVLTALEDPGVGPAFISLVRNLGTHGESRRIFLRFVNDELLDTVAPQLPGERSRSRVSLAGSQLLGLIMGRYVLKIEPLAELSIDEVAGAVGPTIDRYILGELHLGRSGDGRS